MTPTNQQINKALAIAIGWKPEQIIEYEGQEYIGLPVVIAGRPMIKLFNHKFPTVIWPIAEKFDAFPTKHGDRWYAWAHGGAILKCHPNPCTASALAVIKAMGVPL